MRVVALLGTRTGRLNMMRGILRELGVVIPEGPDRVLAAVSLAMSESNGLVPPVLHTVLVLALGEVRELDERIEKVKEQLEAVARTVRRRSRHQSIPARRTREMRQMSSVGPTRGKADNTAGPTRPLFNDWLPVCGFHPGPEPMPAPTTQAVDTSAVATFAHRIDRAHKQATHRRFEPP